MIMNMNNMNLNCMNYTNYTNMNHMKMNSMNMNKMIMNNTNMNNMNNVNNTLNQFNPNDSSQILLNNTHNYNNFINEFNLLKTYYNYRIKFEKMLEKGQNGDSFIQNTFYVIDKKWLKNWENYIGYTNIRKYLNVNRELNDNDFNWVAEIYKKTSTEHPIYQLNNKSIYYNGELNALSGFFIIDNKCFDLFKALYTKNDLLDKKSFPIRFYREKLLLIINRKSFYFILKEKHLCFELVIIFTKENKDSKSIVLDSLKNNDIIKWLNKHHFDLYSNEESDIKEYNCELKIINKTVKFKKKNNCPENNIIPKTKNEMNNYYLNTETNLPSNMKNEIINQETVVGSVMNISNNINNSMHRTGLQNVGQTCYMNATIQCLSNISELSQKLLNIFNNKQFDIAKQPLTVSFSSLLCQLINYKEKYIVPSLFKEIIGKLNPLFKGLHAADSKDLIFFILKNYIKN